MHRSLTHVSALTALCSGATLLAALGVTRAALADEACGDVTCPKGFECEITTLGCPLIACAEGDECEPCVPEEIGTCVPVPCTSDESCGPHMVCAEQDRVSCSAVSKPACAEGEECIEPDIEPECETTTVSQCVPQWELPCTSAADCGEGFTCEPIMQCACSGSAGAVAEPGTAAGGGTDSVVSSGGAAPSSPVDPVVEPVDVEEDCSCTPTGEMQCKPVETACETAADCPTDWTCEDNPDGVCWADTEGNSGCEPADPPRLCRPPYGDLNRGVLAGEATALGLGEASAADAESPAVDSGVVGPTNSTGSEPADVFAGSEEDLNAAGGGCSVTSAGSAPGSLVVLLAGLAGMLGLGRRRR